jgi:hypothetical protein
MLKRNITYLNYLFYILNHPFPYYFILQPRLKLLQLKFKLFALFAARIYALPEV